MKELYLFTNGVQNVGFSPHLFTETVAGVTYTATAIKRTGIVLSGNLAKSQVTFTLPNSNEFAKLRLFNLPEEGWLVKILQDGEVQWTGRVITVALADSTITITTDSSERKNRRNPTGARFALHCWKTLYSPACGVPKESQKITYAVTVTGSVLTLTSAPPLVPNIYLGGTVEKAGESRRIVGNTVNTLTLSSPFQSTAGLAAGNADVYPGCGLTRADCKKFTMAGLDPALGNVANFGGFDFIPTKNPTERSGML